MAGRNAGTAAFRADKQRRVVCGGRNLSDHLLQWEKGQFAEVAFLRFLSGASDALLSDPAGLAGEIGTML